MTGRIGVGIGAGGSWDPLGTPSPHAKSCGSGLIARTVFNSGIGAGFGPISAQASFAKATENVFDPSPKRYPGDWGTNGYTSKSKSVVGFGIGAYLFPESSEIRTAIGTLEPDLKTQLA